MIKSFIWILTLVSGMVMQSCDKESRQAGCDSFGLGEKFTGKVGETWCLENGDLKLTFKTLLEDSRCNVQDLVCVWEGRYVMSVVVEQGGIELDTFEADGDWRDTLHHAPYMIILDKVYPLMRPTMEMLDTSDYAFDIIVQQ